MEWFVGDPRSHCSDNVMMDCLQKIDSAMTRHPTSDRRALHWIASFEACKGIAVLAGSFGLLSFLHHDARQLVHELIAHLGMNSEGRYPLVLLRYADLLASTDLRLLVSLAAGYATVRLIEAYGYGKIWRGASGLVPYPVGSTSRLKSGTC